MNSGRGREHGKPTPSSIGHTYLDLHNFLSSMAASWRKWARTTKLTWHLDGPRAVLNSQFVHMALIPFELFLSEPYLLMNGSQRQLYQMKEPHAPNLLDFWGPSHTLPEQSLDSLALLVFQLFQVPITKIWFSFYIPIPKICFTSHIPSVILTSCCKTNPSKCVPHINTGCFTLNPAHDPQL